MLRGKYIKDNEMKHRGGEGELVWRMVKKKHFRLAWSKINLACISYEQKKNIKQ